MRSSRRPFDAWDCQWAVSPVACCLSGHDSLWTSPKVLLLLPRVLCSTFSLLSTSPSHFFSPASSPLTPPLFFFTLILLSSPSSSQTVPLGPLTPISLLSELPFHPDSPSSFSLSCYLLLSVWSWLWKTARSGSIRLHLHTHAQTQTHKSTCTQHIKHFKAIKQAQFFYTDACSKKRKQICRRPHPTPCCCCNMLSNLPVWCAAMNV